MTGRRRTAAEAALAVGLLLGTKVRAEELDPARLQEITGARAERRGEVVRIAVPRADLPITVDGLRLDPYQGLTSWAAFQRAGDHVLVMGDLVLFEDEVNPVVDAALAGGLEVTALHNHFFFSQPAVYFLHVGGAGDADVLARGVRRALGAVESVRAGGPPASGFGGPQVPTTSSFDAARLGAILVPGESKDGMAKFVIGRTTSMHGAEVGKEMGVNTWAVFRGSPAAAVVDGDFAMLEDELQPVLRALRGGGIRIVAIHHHMTHEAPRVLFLHYWGKGPAEGLAKAVRAALEAQSE